MFGLRYHQKRLSLQFQRVLPLFSPKTLFFKILVFVIPFVSPFLLMFLLLIFLLIVLVLVVVLIFSLLLSPFLPSSALFPLFFANPLKVSSLPSC